MLRVTISFKPSYFDQDIIWPGHCLARTLFGQDIVWPGHYLARTLFVQDIICPGHYLARTLFGQDIVWPGHYLTRTLFDQDIVWPGHCLTRTLFGQDFVWPGQCLARTLFDQDIVWPGHYLSRTLFDQDIAYYIYIYKFSKIKFWWRQIFGNLNIHKPSPGSGEVPHKIRARSVQWFLRLLDTNRQTDKQSIAIAGQTAGPNCWNFLREPMSIIHRLNKLVSAILLLILILQ